MLASVFEAASYTFNPYAIPVFVTGAAMLVLGLGVLIAERESGLSGAFCLMALTVALWLFGYIGVYSAREAAVATWWAKAAHVGVFLIPPAVYHFTVRALFIYAAHRTRVRIAWLLGLVFIPIGLNTDWPVAGVQQFWWGYYSHYDWRSVFLLSYFFLLMLGSLYLLWRAQAEAPEGSSRRLRWRAFMTAFAVGYLGTIDYLPAYGLPVYAGGYVFVFAFLLLIARAIRKYRLIDITPQFAANEIIQTMGDALLVLDADGVVRVANRAAGELFGLNPKYLVGKPAPMAVPGSFFAERLLKIIQLDPIRDYEINYVRPRGEERILSFSATAIADRSGLPAAVVCVARDVTEKRQAEEALRRLNAELEQRVAERTAQLTATNQELESFAYSVSHDLRAPLRSIDGFSKVVLTNYEQQLDERGRDYLHRVRSASQRMAGLIDDLLALSRITRAEMRLQRVDLSALARSILAELQESQPERQVLVSIQDDLTAECDLPLLRIALGNLLGNAWKYTGKRAQAHVEFGAVVQDGKMAFFVRDNGAGFDMTYGDKLFGAFQRLHSASEFEGNGIGLATVQRIIRRHGGAVWAEAEVDRGATFYFTLAP